MKWASMTPVSREIAEDQAALQALANRTKSEIPKEYEAVGDPDIRVAPIREEFRVFTLDDGTVVEGPDFVVRIEFEVIEK